MLHDEADDVAGGAAAEAVEEALLVVDREARRLLLVERTAGLELTLGAALQRNPLAEHVGHLEAGAQLFEEAGRKGHAGRANRRGWTAARGVQSRAFRSLPLPTFGRGALPGAHLEQDPDLSVGQVVDPHIRLLDEDVPRLQLIAMARQDGRHVRPLPRTGSADDHPGIVGEHDKQPLDSERTVRSRALALGVDPSAQLDQPGLFGGGLLRDLDGDLHVSPRSWDER